MQQIDGEKLKRFARRMDSRGEKESRKIMNVTDREVEELYEKDDEETEAKGGFYETFTKDESIFYSFVGYTVPEFEILHGIVLSCMNQQGRGRRSKLGSKDILFLMIYYIRRYPLYETIRRIFHIPSSTFKEMLDKYIPLLATFLEQKFITELSQNCQITSNDDFENCGYIVDATVQEIEIPKSSFESKSPYWSGKHQVYGIKSQAIVTFQGVAVHIATGIKAGIHDKAVFDQSYEDFKQKVLSYHQKEPQKIIGDKGYQDNESSVLVTPFKGTIFNLKDDQLLFNQNLGKIRVIVENYFGRVKNRYRITKECYRGSLDKYPLFFIMCCALVNFEISMLDQPLRESDSIYYRKVITLMIKNQKLKKEKIAQKYKKSKKKRFRRIADYLENSERSDSDFDISSSESSNNNDDSS